ncbi:F-box domain [Macleaya cordata]|uniref:F-box domain n=1 Tax=Macleaya cordata TaxID=56857 RepID=A0A200RDR0_MACCD|nr:F-box domain [Macleaya cordata]
MSSLPEEIIVNIISRLPVKSILRFRCVCKPWCKVISSPNFIQTQVKHAIENNNISLMLKTRDLYSIDYDASSSLSLSDEVVEIDYPFKSPNHFVRIEASCNGLLCINISWDDSFCFICLWNPSTKEYKKIPTPPIKYPSHLLPHHIEMLRLYNLIHHPFTYGFGYDCNIEDKKLVRIVDLRSSGSEFRVYTLGSNSWRLIPNVPYSSFYQGRPGVLVNGALHWTATHCNESKSVVSFDIGDERFQGVPQPEYLDDKVHVSLGVLRGCLCIFGHLHMVRTMYG